MPQRAIVDNYASPAKDNLYAFRCAIALSVSGAPERSSATKHGSNGSKLLQSQATQLNSRAYQTPGAR